MSLHPDSLVHHGCVLGRHGHQRCLHNAGAVGHQSWAHLIHNVGCFFHTHKHFSMGKSTIQTKVILKTSKQEEGTVSGDFVHCKEKASWKNGSKPCDLCSIQAGWSITARGRRISLPTEAYPPATFPKAYMVNLRLDPPKQNKTYAAGVYYCISLDNLERGNGAVCSLY